MYIPITIKRQSINALTYNAYVMDEVNLYALCVVYSIYYLIKTRFVEEIYR